MGTDEPNTNQEISLRTIFTRLRSGIRYFRRKWRVLALATLIGTVSGLAYSFFRKTTYTATCTFVLDDDNKTGAMIGQYANLAALAGLNINTSSGIFQGDNILELYKSRFMIEKTLLQPIEIAGKQQLLIDRYIAFNRLRETWWDRDHIGGIVFTGDPEHFSRKQDSLVSDIVNLFNKKLLHVYRPDKKLSIIEVDFASHDELFAKDFTEQLVTTVNDFYIKTIAGKSAQNVLLLQRQADSVKALLNTSLSGVASAADAAPNANPLMLSLKVPSQRKQVDVQANTAIYSAIMQNLEIAKITLRQATPLIQLLDKPVLPLANDRMKALTGSLLGACATFLLVFLILFIQKVYRLAEQ